MTPDQLQTAGIRLYGRHHWKLRLAEALAVNVSTIHRIMHRAEIPGPIEVAVKGLLAHKKAQDAIEKEARKLLPRKFRKRPPNSKRVKHKKEKTVEKIPYAGAECLEPDSADEPIVGD